MSEPIYEYLEAEVVESVGKTANQWAADGWEVVSVFPRPREGFWDIIAFNLLFKRPLQTPPYVVGKNVDHNHPLGVGCGDDCPVLIQWSNLGGPKGPRG